MKNLTLSLSRLTFVLAGALSLGACNRAGYATLSPSAAPLASVPMASEPTQVAPYVPVAAEESAVVKAPAPTAVVPTPTPLAQPAPAVVAAPAGAVATSPVVAATPAPKPNLVQRLALRKLAKKLDKLTAQAPQFKKQDASAARGGLDSNLRSAILFGLIGIILLLFSGVSGVFTIVGTILLIIGLVFLVLWLLDQA